MCDVFPWREPQNKSSDLLVYLVVDSLWSDQEGDHVLGTSKNHLNVGINITSKGLD